MTKFVSDIDSMLAQLFEQVKTLETDSIGPDQKFISIEAARYHSLLTTTLAEVVRIRNSYVDKLHRRSLSSVEVYLEGKRIEAAIEGRGIHIGGETPAYSMKVSDLRPLVSLPDTTQEDEVQLVPIKRKYTSRKNTDTVKAKKKIAKKNTAPAKRAIKKYRAKK